MNLKFTLLGCGNSSGVPAVGNYWGDCDPNEPKNRRFRCSLAVQSPETTLVIDTGADFRHQMNAFNIQSLDGVFYTHQHSDHCHGIDDLRSFFFRNDKVAIPCYGNESTLNELSQRFDYLFKGGNNQRYYPPIVKPCLLETHQFGVENQFNDITFIPFEMDHGTCTALGYRFKNLSYCVDMKTISEKSLQIIKGSDIWIVDGAGYHNPDNAVHANLQTLYEYNKIIGAKEVYITCLSSLMDYDTLRGELPDGFFPAYDGLTFLQ